MNARGTRWQWGLKYALDWLVAAALFFPLIVIIAGLGVVLYLDSPGPILFRQQRPGRNGKLFAMYKLRTMTPGDHTAQTPRNPDGSLKLTGTLGGYTRFGKWLRRFSLDELPQIYNILKGQMSFIGPRPDLPEHLALYTETEVLKLAVRPGLTGLAQVSGRNELPWKDRLQLDLAYVQEYSLWLDLKIGGLTLIRMLSGRGVYQR